MMGSGLHNHKLIYLFSEILGTYDDFEQSFRIEHNYLEPGSLRQQASQQHPAQH